MILIVGLGNIGQKYLGTRHNVGFELLDIIASRHSASWLVKSKFESSVASLNFGLNKVILCKPGTFVNRSGISVRAISSFYKIQTENIIVIHDDLDLSIGRVKYKLAGGSAGHNGIKSIDSSLHSQQYHRIRIGIGRPILLSVSDYVLGRFIKEEILILEKKFEFITDHVKMIADKDFSFLNSN